MKLTQGQIERFWKKVRKMDTGCWEWWGACRPDGYGLVHISQPDLPRVHGRCAQKMVLAHRVAWLIEHGELPPARTADGERLVLMHTCDNRRCVRHLKLGTAAENSADMASKGRASQGDGHYARAHPELLARGSLNGSAKLDEETVSLIKGWLNTAPRSMDGLRPMNGVFPRIAETLAIEFGLVINPSQIERIAKDEVWSHVQADQFATFDAGIPIFKPAVSKRKLTDEEVLTIRAMRAQKATLREISSKFPQVSMVTISNICLGKFYKNLTASGEIKLDYRSERPDVVRRGSNIGTSKLDEQKVLLIKKAIARAQKDSARRGWKNSLAQQFGISKSAISDIIMGRTWTQVQIEEEAEI